MILTITMHAHQLVQSDQCAVYLHEEQRGTLWSVTGSTGKDVRIPADKGITGCAVQEKKPILVEDVTQDERYQENENLCGKSPYYLNSFFIPRGGASGCVCGE